MAAAAQNDQEMSRGAPFARERASWVGGREDVEKAELIRNLLSERAFRGDEERIRTKRRVPRTNAAESA